MNTETRKGLSPAKSGTPITDAAYATAACDGSRAAARMADCCERLETDRAALIAALESARASLAELAGVAGDVPEWNIGGQHYETARQIRATLAKVQS